MEFQEKEVQTLIDLGLTSLQARIYLTLCKTGTTKVSLISKVSKVARSDVYRTLSKLQELGLVEKEITSPIRFRAIPIETGLTILLERKAVKYNSVKSKTESLLLNSKNNTRHVKPYQEESHFVWVPSSEVLIQRLRKAVESAQTSIDVSTSAKRFKFACYTLAGDLNKAWLRGVKGRVIIEETEESLLECVKSCWKSPFAEIRYVRTIPETVIAMYDKKEVFIYIRPTADLDASPALWSNAPSLLAMAEDHFETLWNTAIEENSKNEAKSGQK